VVQEGGVDDGVEQLGVGHCAEEVRGVQRGEEVFFQVGDRAFAGQWG